MSVVSILFHGGGINRAARACTSSMKAPQMNTFSASAPYRYHSMLSVSLALQAVGKFLCARLVSVFLALFRIHLKAFFFGMYRNAVNARIRAVTGRDQKTGSNNRDCFHTTNIARTWPLKTTIKGGVYARP